MSDCLPEVLHGYFFVAVCLTFHRRQPKAMPNQRVANNVTKENATHPSPFPAQSISSPPCGAFDQPECSTYLYIFLVFYSVLLKYFIF